MITIVSGIPRSGTSMMMQMLAAGGLPVLSDNLRMPDADNPRGYFEWEPAKKLLTQPELIAQAEGKCVKVISQLLFALPAAHEFQILFINRDLAEVLASQAEMTRRLGTTVAGLDPAVLRTALQAHLQQVKAWLGNRKGVRVLELDYSAVVSEPEIACQAISQFLNTTLDLAAMKTQVDRALHRQRASKP
jgi:hypothetical protein